MKIAIVNDLEIARVVLRRVVSSIHECELLWEADNGLKALEMQTVSPVDLIIMDIHMPQMGGVQATRLIMREAPCSILIVTSSVNENVSPVYDALGAGAIDAASTPEVLSDGSLRGDEILIHKINTIRKLVERNVSKPQLQVESPSVSSSTCQVPLVVVGASTGGPRALVEILSRLPARFPASMVIVQHIDTQFLSGLIEWLDKQTELPVVEAEYGSMPQTETIHVAPTHHHLILNPEGAFTPLQDHTHSFVPSVDLFFESVATHWSRPGLALLLTGMGRDGAEGLLSLRKSGWTTLAQDEESSIVYGMPKAAAQLDAAIKILPVHQMADPILAYAQSPTPALKAIEP